MRSWFSYFSKYAGLFKWVGAILGYTLDGALGALLGLIFFKALQYVLVGLYHPEQKALLYQKVRPEWKYFFQSTFSILGYMAKIDGRVSEDEISLTKRMMKELLLNAREIELAKSFFNTGKQPYFNLVEALSIFQRYCEHNSYLTQLFLNFQYRMAQTDRFPIRKQELLDRILKQLGFKVSAEQGQGEREKTYYEEVAEERAKNENSGFYTRTAPLSRLEKAYVILNLKNTQASKEEVKRAYRKLMSSFHPDKLMAQGFSEAEIKAATLKTQEIRKAYDDICEYKGW